MRATPYPMCTTTDMVVIAWFTALVAYFACQQVFRKPLSFKGWLSAPCIAFGLYTLAVVYWALDIRILWLELFQMLPSVFDPALDIDTRAALYANHGILSFVQNIFCICIVCGSFA